MGPDAYPGVAVGGGSAGVRPFTLVSDLEGIQKAAGADVTVFYDRGLPTVPDLARDTHFFTEASGEKPGATLDTFNNLDVSGPAESTKVVKNINDLGMSWETLAADPETAMALFMANEKYTKSRRWTGYYRAATDGPYEVVLEGPGEGGGNRLFVDDKLVFDNWKLVRAFQPHTTLQLTAGPHKVVAEDYRYEPVNGKLRVGIADERTLVSAKAKALAAKADVVVIAAGFDNASEGEGGDRTFDLPIGQDEMIREIAAANPHTVVAMTSGGNVDSSAWLEKIPAYLETWYGGEQGGTALGEILFGAVNPSGHLPATFERHAEDNPTYYNYYPEGDSIRVVYKEGVFEGYRGYEQSEVKPLFPFGFGLSYTTFKYWNLAVSSVVGSSGAGGSGPHYKVSFDLTNTGQRAGATVAQVYVGEAHASVPRPLKELRGFQRIPLQPGQTKIVEFPLTAKSLAYWDLARHAWVVEPDQVEISVGGSSIDDHLKTRITVQ